MNESKNGKKVTFLSKEQFSILLSDEKHVVVQKRHIKQKSKQQNIWFYLGYVGEIGYVIALPIVGGALLGKYIDAQLSLYPRVTISLLFVGSVISILGFIRTIQDLIRRKN